MSKCDVPCKTRCRMWACSFCLPRFSSSRYLRGPSDGLKLLRPVVVVGMLIGKACSRKGDDCLFRTCGDQPGLLFMMVWLNRAVPVIYRVDWAFWWTLP